MSNDDRFRPEGPWQPDRSGENPAHPDGNQPQPPHPGQPASQGHQPGQGQWQGQPNPQVPYGQGHPGSPQSGQGPYSGQSPQTGQGPYGQGHPGSPQSGQGPYSGQSPQTGQGPYGQGQYSGQSPQTGQFAQQPTGQLPAQQGGYPGGPGGPGYPGGGPPQKGRGRSTAIIAVLVVIVLILVGLGVWWWLGRSDAAEAADGAESATVGAELFVERVNDEGFDEIYKSISPAEQQYASAMATLLMRYSWEAGGVELNPDEAQEEILDSLGDYSEVADFELVMGSSHEVELNDTMTAVVVSEGSISLEITDIDEFADITGDLLAEAVTDEQLRDTFGVSSVEELKSMMAQELRASGQTEFSANFSDFAPLMLVMVEEEKGWYLSPVSSAVAYVNIDYFTDEGLRASFIQRNGDFSLATPERADSPEAAAENFVNALANEPIVDALGHLPLAERRGLGLALYLADIPELRGVSFGEIVTLSNLTTTTIEISDHAALALLQSLRINANPALTGQAMEIVLENGQMTIGTCTPIDVSLLLDEDTPMLAFATVEDESGWNVSLFGTFLNAIGAATVAGQNFEDYSDLAMEFQNCLG